MLLGREIEDPLVRSLPQPELANLEALFFAKFPIRREHVEIPCLEGGREALSHHANCVHCIDDYYWVELAQNARRTSSLWDKVRLFLARPGWHPDELGGYVAPREVDEATYRKFDTPTSRRRGLYVLGQFALVLTGTSILLFNVSQIDEARMALASILVAASLVTLGGLLEKSRWSAVAEAARIALVPGLLAALLAVSPAALAGAAAFSLLS